ncbi:MAG: chloride channel protein [Bacteroidales bacterium]|nr:chloride channel protein [Bacteroidales bacterium]
MSKKSLLIRLLVWRKKNISQRNFILILSVLVGMSGGFVALTLKTSVFYLHELLLKNKSFDEYNLLIFIYPFIGIALTFLFVKFLLQDRVKHNIASILYAISKRNSLMRAHKMFSSIIGGILTAGFGGSIGLESPIISSGSAIGSNIGKVLRLSYKEVTLLLSCGAAGAISAIFHTPIAAIVFAIEVLLIDLNRFTLIPLLIASVSGAIITNVFFQDEILFEFVLKDPYVIQHTIFYIFLGILTGLTSVYFTKVFFKVERKANKVKDIRRLFIGGLVLGIVLYLFPPLYGEGYQIIKAIFAENYSSVMQSNIGVQFSNYHLFFYSFFILLLMLKPFATSITINIGGVGGVIAPSLFSGAIAGMLFSHTLNLLGFDISESNFALVGMAGVLSGVLHAPLTAIFLIAETTKGYELIVPLMLTTIVSFVTAKFFEPNSIFTIQLAKSGDLITHHKDKAVLIFMKLKSVIENDFTTIHVDSTLGDLVHKISKSKRNIFPVVDDDQILIGIILMDDIREIMFDKEMYETTLVSNLMILPPSYIGFRDTMKEVIQKFEDSGAWNLPVIENAKYIGMVSKSKLFSAYRNLLLEISDE